MIGIIYVKNRWPGDLQKKNGVMMKKSNPMPKMVMREEIVRS
jgi:hypothetical protein